MIHLYSALGLTLLALGGAGYALYAQAKHPAQPNPYPAVALLLAAVVALIAPEPIHFFLKGCIALAILLLLVARLLLLIPKTPRSVAQATHLLVHFLLWLGLLITIGRAFWGWPALLALLGLAAGGGYGWLLRPGMAARREGELRLTVLLYAINAGLMVGAAAAFVLHAPALWSVLALGGALLLALDDALRAWDRWRRPLPRIELWTSALQMVGALLLAWSIWGV